MDMSLSKVQEIVDDRGTGVLQCMGKQNQTQQGKDSSSNMEERLHVGFRCILSSFI